MIYSANVLIWNSQKEVLVVSRKEDNNKYCLPGGKVDTTDYDDYYRTHYYKHFSMPEPGLAVLRRCASRELKEECGVYIRPDDLQRVFMMEHKWKDETYVCTTFWGKTSEEPRPGEPGTWTGWRRPDQLMQESNCPFSDLNVALFNYLGVR